MDAMLYALAALALVEAARVAVLWPRRGTR